MRVWISTSWEAEAISQLAEEEGSTEEEDLIVVEEEEAFLPAEEEALKAEVLTAAYLKA